MANWLWSCLLLKLQVCCCFQFAHYDSSPINTYACSLVCRSELIKDRYVFCCHSIILKVGGVCRKCSILKLKWTDLIKEQPVHLYREAAQKEQGQYNETKEKAISRRLPAARLCCWPNLSIHWTVDISKCFLLGRLYVTNSTDFK